MMQRLVLVVNTGGSEGLSMVKGIRSAGVFCTMTDAARLFPQNPDVLHELGELIHGVVSFHF